MNKEREQPLESLVKGNTARVRIADWGVSVECDSSAKHGHTRCSSTAARDDDSFTAQ